MAEDKNIFLTAAVDFMAERQGRTKWTMPEIAALQAIGTAAQAQAMENQNTILAGGAGVEIKGPDAPTVPATQPQHRQTSHYGTGPGN